MVNNIYGVNHSTHLTNDGNKCTIFIIGETHVSYTKCNDKR